MRITDFEVVCRLSTRIFSREQIPLSKTEKAIAREKFRIVKQAVGGQE